MNCPVPVVFHIEVFLMNIVTITSCPVCGKTKFEHAMRCVDHYASGENFRLERCAACGFLFTQDFPAEASMGRYYDTKDYISHSDTRKGLVNTVYHQVRRYMLGRKARLVMRKAHRREGRLLDIGTGTGYFANAMLKRGWQVAAVEKNEGARRFAYNRFGLEVKPETELGTFADGAFDVITLWHVMEHLEHLNETWETLYRLLDTAGVLVVAVPNPSSSDARHYGCHWAAYDVPRHLWHFTPAVMQRLGAKHGFVLEEHFPLPFDAFYIAMLSEQYLNRRMAGLRGLWQGTRAWLATQARKERGSSLVYVFRKQKPRKEGA